MDDSVTRLAKLLGAVGIESAGHDARFSVDGADGSRLKVSIEGDQQRIMAVLIDPAGVTRTTLDLAPVTQVTETKHFPGRVTLHLGKTAVHIDTRPSLAIELVSVDDD